ncbi:unnamed protein product [Hymenolepis diminuta]|uniref:Uncharacterized protein n=1 Tax=Hymenolepis diminuta TaxID=6216 RepID=A0A3P6ZJU5_HYMDI|nr:unnamed protein product [Hymenolepis diminuta]
MNTTEPARFYRLSAPFNDILKNKDKNMCLQFTVKYPLGADCSGGYVKLIGGDFKQDEFNGETPYEIIRATFLTYLSSLVILNERNEKNWKEHFIAEEKLKEQLEFTIEPATKAEDEDLSEHETEVKREQY